MRSHANAPRRYALKTLAAAVVTAAADDYDRARAPK